MSTTTIRNLPLATKFNSADYLVISQGGVDKRISADKFIEDLNGGNPFNVTPIDYSGTNLTIDLSYRNSYIRTTSDSSVLITVVSSEDAPWRTGDSIVFLMEGEGAVSVVGGSGVTLSGSLTGQGQLAQIIYVGDDTWDFITPGETFSSQSLQATVGGAGGASALPATPSQYLQVQVDGTEYVIPLFAKE